MSDTFDHSGLPEDELLAAEYALGVLDGIDRATAEQRVARDRGFARQVAAWEQRLAPWAAEIPEVASAAARLGSHRRRPAPANPHAPVCGRASHSGADWASRPAPSPLPASRH